MIFSCLNRKIIHERNKLERWIRSIDKNWGAWTKLGVKERIFYNSKSKRVVSGVFSTDFNYLRIVRALVFHPFFLKEKVFVRQSTWGRGIKSWLFILGFADCPWAHPLRLLPTQVFCWGRNLSWRTTNLQHSHTTKPIHIGAHGHNYNRNNNMLSSLARRVFSWDIVLKTTESLH